MNLPSCSQILFHYFFVIIILNYILKLIKRQIFFKITFLSFILVNLIQHQQPCHLWHEDPMKFIPDRFLKNFNASNKAATFLSFGIGPRQCIVNRFALLEIKTVFFHLLARSNFRICSKTSVPLKVSKKSLGFAFNDSYWMKLKMRKTTFSLKK